MPSNDAVQSGSVVAYWPLPNTPIQRTAFGRRWSSRRWAYRGTTSFPVVSLRVIRDTRGVMTIPIEDIRRLSVAERIQLVEDIWDTIAMSHEEVPLTEAQRAELDRRLDEHSQDPSKGRSWDAVREDLGHSG